MQRVQLAEAEVRQDQMSLISVFVKAAHAQGFAIEWIEAVMSQALANQCVNFWTVMLAHIEIIPAVASPNDDKFESR